jgi:hypothetical protein
MMLKRVVPAALQPSPLIIQQATSPFLSIDDDAAPRLP